MNVAQKILENVHDIFEELDMEIKNNVEKFKNFKKTPVEFGHSIQFEHVKSHKYLSFHLDHNKYVFSENQGFSCIYSIHYNIKIIYYLPIFFYNKIFRKT